MFAHEWKFQVLLGDFNGIVLLNVFYLRWVEAACGGGGLEMDNFQGLHAHVLCGNLHRP